jgi:hypothetical protein
VVGVLITSLPDAVVAAATADENVCGSVDFPLFNPVVVLLGTLPRFYVVVFRPDGGLITLEA